MSSADTDSDEIPPKIPVYEKNTTENFGNGEINGFAVLLMIFGFILFFILLGAVIAYFVYESRDARMKAL